MAHHTILLVDDDALTRQTLAALLDLDRLSVVTAHDGPDALDRLNHGLEPCLILLDVEGARTKGADFRRVQEADPRLSRFPVAVISALPDIEQTARRLGIRDFLRKPILVDAVKAIVDRNCQRHPASG